MPNSFVTIQEIARETLPRLIDNLVFPNLVHRDFSDDFARKQGDTIQVRKPVVLEASEFDASTGTSAQDLKEDKVLVKLDKIATVDVDITAIQGATNINDLSEQFLIPAAVALATKINSDGLALYKDIPYIGGTAGTTPDGLDDIAAARKILNANKAPVTPRYGVWDTEADAALVTVPAIVNAEKSGSTEALREGSLGRVMGIDNYMSQAVKTHTTGITAATAVKVNGAVTAGATQLAIDGTSLTGKLVKGDVLTIGGRHYVVTEDTSAASSNAIATVKVYPALPSIADNADVTLTGSHTANLVFHPSAFAFVTRPLVKPSGVESYVTNYNGISLRVVKGYDMTYKKETLSMDVLYGYKTLYPELAARYLG